MIKMLTVAQLKQLGFWLTFCKLRDLEDDNYYDANEEFVILGPEYEILSSASNQKNTKNEELA